MTVSQVHAVATPGCKSPGMISASRLTASKPQFQKGEKTMRERFVTRTVVTVNYEVMSVNTADNTVETVTVSIPSGDTMTEKARAKAIADTIPEGYIPVKVTGQTVTETLYGMPEADFIKYAKVLPPRTTQK